MFNFNVTWGVLQHNLCCQKKDFTEGHNEPFWNEEAAVEALAKGCFWDKLLTVKGLFEIDKF